MRREIAFPASVIALFRGEVVAATGSRVGPQDLVMVVETAAGRGASR